MSGTPNIAAVGQILGDPTRCLMLEVLYDGRAWTASELAAATSVTPQTASTHLRKLLDAGFIAVEQSGRHRYFRLASTEVAEALEALLILATQRNLRPGLKEIKDDPLRHARTCYDHAAGQFGVALLQGMKRQAWLREGDEGFVVTPKGEKILLGMDIDCAQLRGGRRPLTRKCIDWSERRHHLGGALGAALADKLFENRWIQRVGNTRALKITPRGKRELAQLGLYQQ